MKAKFWILGLVACLVPVMAATNPGLSAYTNYAVVKYDQSLRDAQCSGVTLPGDLGILNALTQDACKGLLDLSPQSVHQYAQSRTLRQNWLLFSVYVTKLPNQSLYTLGALGNFSPLSR